MLKVKEFDIKTGKNLTDYDPKTNSQIPRTKDVEKSRLEHWLQGQMISEADSQLSVAQFYDGVNEQDVKNLLDRGQELVFTSGKFAYFATPKMAKLMLELAPIYDNGENIAHNVVAYGSLIISDGVSQTSTDRGEVKVLLIDNVNRSFGDQPLLDKKGKPFTDGELDKLLDVMGDGTMLIPSATMQQLLLSEEISTAIETGLKKAKVESNPELIDKLIHEYQSQGTIRLSNANLTTSKVLLKELNGKIERSVIQFRAALSDVSGIAKGTAKTSDWCRKLGVDAIISLDDVKGAKQDGVLDRPGLVEVNSNLWMNRKDIAQYADQTVGAQVKYKIPNATLTELNPHALNKAKELAVVAKDPYLMAQRQVAKVERRRERPLYIDHPEGTPEERELDLVNQIESLKNDEAAALVLQADKYGQIIQMPSIRNQLARSIRSDWLDVATAGIEIPAAMAQHHAALQSWEICNKDLPEGAIVAYYRSPFGNVGAAAIAINHRAAIAKGDPESYNKDGVSYLPPWTSKNIAITDFDSDRNGYFVGFIVKDPQATMQGLRDRLADISDPALQYEAARHEFDLLIQQQAELTSSEYPDAVTEFIEANRPEHKPMPIPKDKKVMHPRLPNEHLSMSIGNAWVKTAQNPVGLVADQSMILESLAQHITYTEGKTNRRDLCQKVVASFKKIKPEVIPSDRQLEKSGLPPLNLAARIQSVAYSEKENYEQTLQAAVSILEDYAKYPMAKNLQIAVDIQKSNVGIDQALHKFGNQLSYQKHGLRGSIKSSQSYANKPLQNNTADPVGQQVSAVNELFEGIPKLPLDREDENRAFRSVIPEIHKGHETEIALANNLTVSYDSLTEKLSEFDQKLSTKNSAYQQPSLTFTSIRTGSRTGRAITVDRLADAQAMSPINLLELDGTKAEFFIAVNPNYGYSDKKKDLNYPYLLENADKTQVIGFITRDSLRESFQADPRTSSLSTEGIEKEANAILKKIDQRITNGRDTGITGTIETIPPFAIQNDKDQLHHQMNTIIDSAKQQVKGQEAVMLSVFTHTSTGQGMSLKILPREFIKHLDKVEKFEIFGATNLTSHQDAIVRIDNVLMTEKGTGDLKNTPIGSLVNQDGTLEILGQIDQHVAPMAPGTLIKASIHPQLDPNIRIEIPGMKLLGVKDPTIDAKIPTQSGKFAFKREPDKVSVYLLTDNGETTKLGILNDTAKKQLRSNSLSEPMEGTYRRGLYQGTKNATQKLYLQVTELVEHQPVPEQITAQENFDDSITITSAPFEYHQTAVSTPNLTASPTATQSQDANKYTPSRFQLANWYKASAKDSADRQTIEYLGKKLTTTYQAQESANGQTGNPTPDNYRHPNVAISMEQKHQFDRSLREVRPIEVTNFNSDNYVPNRAEIIEWLQAANPHSSDSRQIWDLGVRLKSVYLAQGNPETQQIPNSYRDDTVSISADDKQRFDQFVQTSREQSETAQFSRSY
jgi:hypothetical protein